MTLLDQSSISSNFLLFHTSGGISSRLAAYLFLIFLHTMLSSFCVNCPNLILVFVVHPTNQTSVAQGLVLGGSRCQAVAQIHLASTKMPWASSAFPYKGAPQVPNHKPSLAPPRRIRTGGDVLLRMPCQMALIDCHQNQDTPNLIRVLTEVCPSPATLRDCACALS